MNHNVHNIKFILLSVHTVQCFLAHSEFICHHHYLTSEYFHHIQKPHPYSLAVTPQSAFPLKPWQRWPVSMDLPILGVSYEWITIYGFLWPVSFTYHIFKVHSHCCMYQDFILFYYWEIYLCDTSPLWFHILTIMNNAIMNICLQIFVWKYVFTFLVYIPSIRISG